MNKLQLNEIKKAAEEALLATDRLEEVMKQNVTHWSDEHILHLSESAYKIVKYLDVEVRRKLQDEDE